MFNLTEAAKTEVQNRLESIQIKPIYPIANAQKLFYESEIDTRSSYTVK